MGLLDFLFGSRRSSRDRPRGGTPSSWYARRDKYKRWLQTYPPGSKRHGIARGALKRMGY